MRLNFLLLRAFGNTQYSVICKKIGVHDVFKYPKFLDFTIRGYNFHMDEI